MNKKLTIFLLANIPFSVGLYFLFLLLTIEFGYGDSRGYALFEWHPMIIYLLLNLAIDLVILGLMKLLSAKSIFLTLLEIAIFYLTLLWFFVIR